MDTKYEKSGELAKQSRKATRPVVYSQTCITWLRVAVVHWLHNEYVKQRRSEIAAIFLTKLFNHLLSMRVRSHIITSGPRATLNIH